MSDPAHRSSLIVENVHAYYGASHVIQGCSLRVDEECVAVLGRNGMGKTTLLRTIMGLTPPRTGEVRWRDQELHFLQPYHIARTGLGYVPQGRRLFPSLTVEEHLTLPHRKTGGNLEWSPKRVFELFPELEARRRLAGIRLSGGEQQMLAIGRALVTNPGLLLMDEPSEGLSPVAIERVVKACQELRLQGISILLVEQNIHLAEALADRVYIMLAGKTVYEAPTSTFVNQTELRQKLLGI
jgi:branched-chain amino acid transport system ATP-binding protein